MHSVFDLLDRKTNQDEEPVGLYNLAQEEDISGRGSMSRDDLIIALAEEDISPEAEEVIRSSKADLVEEARSEDVHSPTSKPKAELQKTLLNGLVEPVDGSGSEEPSGGAAGASEGGGGEKSGYGSALKRHGDKLKEEAFKAAERMAAMMPEAKYRDSFKGAESSFASAEDRLDAIIKKARSAAVSALHTGESMVVVESFYEDDASDPLRVQPSYKKRERYEMIVFEATAPHYAFPNLNVRENLSD